MMLRVFLKSITPPVLHFAFMSILAVIVTYSVFAAQTDILGMGPEEVPAAFGAFMETPEYITSVISASVYSGLLSIAVFTVMYRRRKPPFAPERAACQGDLLWLVAVIAVAGNLALSTTVSMIQHLLGTNLPVSSIEGLLGNMDEAGMTLLALNVVLIAPIAEELCFRGLAFNRLLAAFPFWKANVIQAAVFGIIHITPIQVAYAFIFGLLLGWIYHRTGRFGAAVLAHIAFNSAPALSAFVPESDNPFNLFLLLGVPSAVVFCLSFKSLNGKLGEA
jgi:hypothetical protein